MKEETIQPVMTIIDLGEDKNQNVSVEEIELSATSVGIGQTIKIRANLRNWGDNIYQGDLVARLFIDGADTHTDEALLSLPAKESTQVLFTHHFKEAGSHTIGIDLSVADDLPQDNRRFASINVIDRLGVLLVDGDPSQEWLRGETDFIKLALTPFFEAEEKKELETKDLIEAQVVSATNFDPVQNLKGQSLVVLANVSKLSEESTKAIETFVAYCNFCQAFDVYCQSALLGSILVDPQ